MPWRKAYESITGVVGVGRLQEGADEVKDNRIAVGKESWECRVATGQKETDEERPTPRAAHQQLSSTTEQLLLCVVGPAP